MSHGYGTFVGIRYAEWVDKQLTGRQEYCIMGLRRFRLYVELPCVSSGAC